MPALMLDTRNEAYQDQALESRARGEYLEMPGLRLTPEEAARLWSMDRAVCVVLLDALTSNGFLNRDENGRYLRNGGGY